MPQMAPLKWLSLYIIFTLTFILFNMINYYSFTPNSPKSNITTEISSNSMNWKW